MELFAFLGTQEIVIVLVLALIVFGPQKLPEIGRQVGAAMRELRKMTGDVQRALDFDDPNTNSYNAYDNTNWYDSAATPTLAAPQGTTVAQSSGGGMLESAHDYYGDDDHSDSAFVAPPGPVSRARENGSADDNKSSEH